METFGKKKDFYFVFRVKVEIMSVNLTLEDSNRLRGICSPITHSKRMLSLLPGEQQPWNSNAKCQACAAAIRKMKVRSNRAERGLRLSSQCQAAPPPSVPPHNSRLLKHRVSRPSPLSWLLHSNAPLVKLQASCWATLSQFSSKKIWPWLTFSFF